MINRPAKYRLSADLSKHTGCIISTVRQRFVQHTTGSDTLYQGPGTLLQAQILYDNTSSFTVPKYTKQLQYRTKQGKYRHFYCLLSGTLYETLDIQDTSTHRHKGKTNFSIWRQSVEQVNLTNLKSVLALRASRQADTCQGTGCRNRQNQKESDGSPFVVLFSIIWNTTNLAFNTQAFDNCKQLGYTVKTKFEMSQTLFFSPCFSTYFNDDKCDQVRVTVLQNILIGKKTPC